MSWVLCVIVFFVASLRINKYKFLMMFAINNSFLIPHSFSLPALLEWCEWNSCGARASPHWHTHSSSVDLWLSRVHTPFVQLIKHTKFMHMIYVSTNRLHNSWRTVAVNLLNRHRVDVTANIKLYMRTIWKLPSHSISPKSPSKSKLVMPVNGWRKSD